MENKNILVIDDEIHTLKVLKAVLTEAGYNVYTSESENGAFTILTNINIHLVLLDLRFNDDVSNGIEILKKIKKFYPDVVVIMMTAYGSIESAVTAMKLGAENYLQKPLNYEELKIIVEKVFEKIYIKEKLDILSGKSEGKYMFEGMIGVSKKMRELFKKIINISKVDSTVLITGESGTGKEMVARAIHNLSNRRNNKFVVLHLASIPETLQESELFGYKKGAFTGAYNSKLGKFKIANSGTLFLDEIANINKNVQAKLLRVIEDKVVEPLGSNTPQKVDVRIISATNTDLKSEVEKGNFREDLYYRLNVISIEVPPLRERKSDIPLLAEHFLKFFCIKNKIKEKKLSDSAIEVLINYDWPGNVRELRNVIEESVAISTGNIITPKDLNILTLPNKNFSKEFFHISLPESEKKLIVEALIHTHGNQTRAAQLLGITRKMLMKKIQKYKIYEIVPLRTKHKKMSPKGQK